MISRWLLVLGACTAPLSHASAQVTITPESRDLIDLGLKALGMTVADCAMPPDYVTADAHRLPMHDALFTAPLSAFDQAHAYADATRISVIVEKAMEDLELGSYRRTMYSARYTPDQIQKRLGVDAIGKFDQLQSVLAMRGLEGILQAIDETASARERWWKQRNIVALCDSLWMNTDSDETLSLFDAYQQQRQDRQRAEMFFQRASPLMLQPVYVQGVSLYEHLLDVAADAQRSARSVGKNMKTQIVETPIGRIGIGGPGNDVYDGMFALIIDMGGDDVYRLGDHSKGGYQNMPIRCIVDLSGNDTYVGGQYSLAAAVCGVGIVIDRDGDDTYRSGDFTQGAAVFGVGILHDLAGNDAYFGGQNTQGAGVFGLGLLIDDDGHDTYRCHAQGQGFGATRGFGMLLDRSGNDQYLAASPYVDVLRYEAHYVTFTQGAALGYRPLASGGIAILADHSGNDVYVTDIYGQGTAYWFGLGAVIDRSGEDRYQAYQYAQGSGVHLATGLLHDQGGDDVYVSHGVSQGCGHDVALGALVDEHGNDSYVTESLSLGGGNANAVSILVDRTGNDSYIAQNEKNTFGYSDLRRYSGMIGIFVDGGGTDRYGETTRNDTITVKSTYGAFVDNARVTDATPSRPEPTYEEMDLSDNVDSLFIQASAAPLKYQNNVKPARDKLVDMGAAVVQHLSQYFGTKMPRERLALEYVLPKIREADTPTVDAYLAAGLQNDDITVNALCATVAGTAKARSMIPYLDSLAQDTSWKKRRIAALAMGRIGDSTAIPALLELIYDKHPMVRARAGYALGLIGGQPALSQLAFPLKDIEQIVRFTTVEGLRRGVKRSFSEVQRELDRHESPSTYASAVRLIACVDTTAQNAEGFREYYSASDDFERTFLDRTLPSLPAFWREALTEDKSSGSRARE